MEPALLFRTVNVLTEIMSGYEPRSNGSRISRRNGRSSHVTRSAFGGPSSAYAASATSCASASPTSIMSK